jgi:hypothetical protein
MFSLLVLGGFVLFIVLSNKITFNMAKTLLAGLGIGLLIWLTLSFPIYVIAFGVIFLVLYVCLRRTR